jgi:hypothetical protein
MPNRDQTPTSQDGTLSLEETAVELKERLIAAERAIRVFDRLSKDQTVIADMGVISSIEFLAGETTGMLLSLRRTLRSMKRTGKTYTPKYGKPFQLYPVTEDERVIIKHVLNFRDISVVIGGGVLGMIVGDICNFAQGGQWLLIFVGITLGAFISLRERTRVSADDV